MSTYLILGGTGKTGRRVVQQLAAAGHVARAAARTPGDPASGVVPTRFDWTDRATWDAALEGADGVYVIPPALRLDYADDVRALVDRAVALGVGSSVFLSARGAEHEPEGPLVAGERAVLDAAWHGSVVRPTWFAQNFTEAFLAPGDDGAIVAPTGHGAVPFIDADDIAAVVVALLTSPGELAGDAYPLSGPAALTFAQAAALLGATHVDPGADAWLAGAAENGLPADYAALLAALFGAIRNGHDAFLSDGVQRVLGREPASLATVLERERAVAAS